MKPSEFLISLFLLSSGFLSAQSSYNYPKTEKESVSDNYFGTKVNDPYRWLEDDRSQKTMDWVSLQNICTQAYFQTLGIRKPIQSRLKELWSFNRQSNPIKKGEYFYCFKN